MRVWSHWEKHKQQPNQFPEGCETQVNASGLTYVHRPAVLHARADERTSAEVNSAFLIRQPPFYQLAVHVDRDDVALDRNPQFVPLAVEEAVQLTALKRVA